jgi:hypothetical protein
MHRVTRLFTFPIDFTVLPEDFPVHPLFLCFPPFASVCFGKRRKNAFRRKEKQMNCEFTTEMRKSKKKAEKLQLYETLPQQKIQENFFCLSSLLGVVLLLSFPAFG